MLTEEPVPLNSNCSIASPRLERQLETVQSTGALFSTVSSNSPCNQFKRAGSFSNLRMGMHPSGPAFSFSRSFESARLNTGSCLTVANTTGRSFVPSIVQRPNRPIQTPASSSPLRPASSHVPNLMPHRTQSAPFQSRPVSVQPVHRFSPPMPRQLVRSFPQSNYGAGLNLSPDTTATTFTHNSSKENLLDSRSNSQSSQSTFRFKKLSTTKPSCASVESTKDPVKETTSTIAMNSPSSVWNSNDYSGKKADEARLFSSGSYLTGAKVSLAFNNYHSGIAV